MYLAGCGRIGALFEKRKNAIITGKGSVSSYENEFFSADTILRIMNDVCSKRESFDKSYSGGGEQFLDYLVDKIDELKSLKEIMFDFIMVSTKPSFAVMTGYKNR